jgi:hypothetical protein
LNHKSFGSMNITTNFWNVDYWNFVFFCFLKRYSWNCGLLCPNDRALHLRTFPAL